MARRQASKRARRRRYNKRRQRLGRKKRRLLEGGYQCRNCGSGLNLTIDHIIPRSKGGKDTSLNTQVLCYLCNQAKADMMPDDPECKKVMQRRRAEQKAKRNAG